MDEKLLQYIPHRKEMLWIDEVVSSHPNGGECLVNLNNKKHYWGSQFRKSSFIELISQAFSLTASHYFFSNKIKKTLKKPMLVGIGEFNFTDSLPVSGDQLRVQVSLERQLGNIYCINGTIKDFKSHETYAFGEVRLYAEGD